MDVLLAEGVHVKRMGDHYKSTNSLVIEEIIATVELHKVMGDTY